MTGHLSTAAQLLLIDEFCGSQIKHHRKRLNFFSIYIGILFSIVTFGEVILLQIAAPVNV